MNALVAIAAAAIAAALAARLRRERQRRTEAERAVRRLERRVEEDARRNRDWLAVFGHELRSPLAAILGYAELLEDGTFGELDERAADAVHRLRASAEQLVGLIEGMDARHFRGEDVEPVAVEADTIAREAADGVAVEAEARGVAIVVEDRRVSLRTRPDVVARTLRLALGAAIKVSQGGSLRIGAVPAPVPHFLISGTLLDPLRDNPDNETADAAQALTGAGLRLSLARVTARQLGGGLTLHAEGSGTTVRIELPEPPHPHAEAAAVD